MSDLIKRLRDKAARFHRMHWKRDYEDISEAADEIERLTAKFEQIDAHITNRIGDKDAEIERLLFERDKYKDEAHLLTKERDQAQAEIERLQESIAKRAENNLILSDENYLLWRVVDAANDWRVLGEHPELDAALAALEEADDD